MHRDNPKQKLANAIESILSKGIGLTDDVVHYLNSAAGVDDAPGLEKLLCQSEDCDAQTLSELIFFPDESQQMQLEPLLEGTAQVETAVDEIIEILIAKDVETTLYFPHPKGACRISIPPYAISQFVRRLRINRVIDKQVADAMEAHIENPSKIRQLRVKLRNARFAFSKNFSSFIRAFLANIAENEPDFWSMVDFAIDTMERVEPTTDIYLALMDRKRLCGEMIRQAQQSDKNLRELPVEALILKGVNIPCINIDDARRQMDLIDRISLRIFGRTELTDHLMAESQQPIELGHFNRHTDIERVIKILS